VRQEISVEELGQWLRERRDFVLLDVREPYEVSVAPIPGAFVVPMREIPERAGELAKDRPVAVICHHGGRSQRVAQFLSACGFASVVNVEGGIDAYSRRVDSSIPVY